MQDIGTLLLLGALEEGQAQPNPPNPKPWILCFHGTAAMTCQDPTRAFGPGFRVLMFLLLRISVFFRLQGSCLGFGVWGGIREGVYAWGVGFEVYVAMVVV